MSEPNTERVGVIGAGSWGTAIADLQENGWHGLVEKNGKLGTSNFGIIEGGDATNVVTDRVTIVAEARSHNRAFRKRIVSEVEKAFQRAAKKIKNVEGNTGHVEIDVQLKYDSFKLSAREPSVKAAAAAVPVPWQSIKEAINPP